MTGDPAREPISINRLALLFTDAKERVVFVDSNFLRLTHFDQANLLTGEPLHNVLGIDPQISRKLIKDIAQSGYVHDWPLELQIPRAGVMQVMCNGVAAYNSQDRFIGADLTLFRSDHSAAPETPITDHQDVLGARIQQLQAEADTLESQTRVQLYLKAQIGALQVLLGRMGGPRIRTTLDNLIHATITENDWPMQIRDGEIVFEEQELDPEIYTVLLSEVIGYAANIIGQRMIAHEMQAVEGQMDADWLEAAEQFGLR